MDLEYGPEYNDFRKLKSLDIFNGNIVEQILPLWNFNRLWKEFFLNRNLG